MTAFASWRARWCRRPADHSEGQRLHRTLSLRRRDDRSAVGGLISNRYDERGRAVFDLINKHFEADGATVCRRPIMTFFSIPTISDPGRGKILKGWSKLDELTRTVGR
jgi:hypothetical protein